MANRTTRRPEKDARLIGMLKAGFGIVAACKRAGYAYRTVKDWRDADPELEREIQSALEEGEEARLEKFESRGVEGWLEPVFHKGKIVGHVQKHSDVAAIFSFKARNRRRFDDRLAVELGGTSGRPIQILQKVYNLDGTVAERRPTDLGDQAEPAQPSAAPTPNDGPIIIKRKEYGP